MFLRYLHWYYTASKGHILYVPNIRKIISSYDVVFDESFPSSLTHTARPYSEAIAMRMAVIYTPYSKYSKEKAVNIIRFAQF